jgi:Tripartite tricarboxylate transporter family receptor
MGGSTKMRRGEHSALRRGLFRFTLGISSIGLLAVPVTAAGASSAPHKKLTLLQQGLNFYKGKTITLIAPDNTGGGFDLTARAVAPFIGQYLGASVNVTNDPPANTIAGQDLFEASPPDGLTMGMVNAGADIEDEVTGQPGVNFNPQKTQFLGGNNGGGAGFSCLATSPYKTFGDVVAATAANPVTETVISTGTQVLNTDLLNAAFALNAKIIGGYASTSLEVAGFERGDGNCGPLGITTGSFGPFLVAGKATELVKFSSVNPATAYYAQQQSTPLLTDEFKAFPAKTKTESDARTALLQLTHAGGHEFNFQPRVANYKVAAMRAAIHAALTNIQCEDKLLSTGQQNGWITGDRELQLYKDEYVALKKVSGIIKTALGV